VVVNGHAGTGLAENIAGGLDGIARRLDPGRRLDINMYEPGAAPAGIPRLPLNLLDALRAFQAARGVGLGLCRRLREIADGALDRLYAPFERMGA
jgi:glutamine synthetase